MAKNCEECIHDNYGCCLKNHYILRKVPFFKCLDFSDCKFEEYVEKDTICDRCISLEKCIEDNKVIDCRILSDERAHYEPNRIMFCEKYLRERYESNT